MGPEASRSQKEETQALSTHTTRLARIPNSSHFSSTSPASLYFYLLHSRKQHSTRNPSHGKFKLLLTENTRESRPVPQRKRRARFHMCSLVHPIPSHPIHIGMEVLTT